MVADEQQGRILDYHFCIQLRMFHLHALSSGSLVPLPLISLTELFKCSYINAVVTAKELSSVSNYSPGVPLPPSWY